MPTVRSIRGDSIASLYYHYGISQAYAKMQLITVVKVRTRSM